MIKCPKCGESYYAIRYSTSTAMYFPVIIKDGINVNPDRNITTTHCECISCSTLFSYEECGGELLSITLDFFPGSEIRKGRPIEGGFGPISSNTNLDINAIRCKVDENVAKWENTAEEINKERILTIKKEIAELQTTLQNTVFDGAKLTYGNYKPSPNSCGE